MVTLVSRGHLGIPDYQASAVNLVTQAFWVQVATVVWKGPLDIRGHRDIAVKVVEAATQAILEFKVLLGTRASQVTRVYRDIPVSSVYLDTRVLKDLVDIAESKGLVVIPVFLVTVEPQESLGFPDILGDQVGAVIVVYLDLARTLAYLDTRVRRE